MLEAVQNIDLPVWINTPELHQLCDLLHGEGSFPKTLMVGGCVRNALINERETDIDLATQYTPEEVISILNSCDLKIIPTGLDHGTVTVVINGHSFEVTTLRSDVDTDGRHATVSYTDDWLEDARRRDFTMNTLLMDLDGNIYDPLGLGGDDAQNRFVRFVGDPAKRIKEDYLRILRFFRFQAQYGSQAYDEIALQACKELSNNVYDLSKERITQEFLKILNVENSTEMLEKMLSHGVLNRLVPDGFDSQKFSNLCDVQNKYDAFNLMARLSFFNVAEYLSLSNVQKKQLKFFTKDVSFDALKDIKKCVYYQGNDNALQLYLLACVRGDKKPHEEFIRTAQNFEAPVFPVTGDDLITEGFKPGPELGKELKRREQEWLMQQC